MILITKFLCLQTISKGMGNMCCQNDKDPKTRSQPLPNGQKHKTDRTAHEQKKQKSKQVEANRPPQIIVPTKDTKPKPENEEQIIKQIEEKYPLPNDKKTIKWEDFNVTHRIGSGGFGEVFLGELIENKAKGIEEKYAIKRILKSQIFERKLTSSIKLQKKILHESKCKFITTLHYAFRDAKYLYLVMEWAQGGDTYSLINKDSKRFEDFKKIGEPAVRFILACLILGMEYLHSNFIMYRDLKPENILIFENGYVKLTDFGLAKEFNEEELSKTEAGTTIYYAPEMVLRQGYGKEIDFWTIGIFAYEMSNYSPPFSGPEIKDRQRVKRLVKSAENNRNWKNPNLSDQLKDFINCLLKFEAKERMGYNSWNDIKTHKFFTCVNFDWQSLEQLKMKSPLRELVQNHKGKYKIFVQQDNRGQHEANSKNDDQLQGWTCKNNSQI